MKLRRPKVIVNSIVIILSLTFVGCSIKNPEVPTPLVDQQATLQENDRQTQAAVTFAAAMTQAADDITKTALAPTASSTRIVTKTASPTVTQTPFIDRSATSEFTPTRQTDMPVIPSVTTTVPSWQCNLIKTTPSYKAVIKRGQQFETHWILLNSGENVWYNINVKAKYRNGTGMQVHADKVAINSAVETGDLYEIVVLMKAPSDPGSYTDVWTLVNNKEDFCWFSVDIVVE